jgi:hypothetical protein
VDNLQQSIEFYSSFFNMEPSVKKEDYAKWMIEDPRINFAISKRGREPGLDHLGIQVDSADDLKEISTRLRAAQKPILEQEQTTCCYAKSDKTWVHDPQGIAWESFYTTDVATTYGEDLELQSRTKSACCAPEAESISVQISKKST